ncbi:Uncharacterised protein [Klebsiella pneumoniae]|nr:Uncharacterised protein [Klebsiella pneumoniae]
MPGIIVAQSFNNAALPAGESLASALIADSGVKNWFQADANYVTLSGNDIASFNDRKGTASKLTRADAANMQHWSATHLDSTPEPDSTHQNLIALYLAEMCWI